MTNNIKGNSNNNFNNNIKGNNNNVNNKNKTNNINNNINYYKYKIVDNKQNKICRPGLKDIGEGKIITFEAIYVGKYTRFSNCITIINIHSCDKFLADHSQLFLNESVDSFEKRNELESCMIQGIGRIKTYPKNNDVDYCLELLPDTKLTYLNDLYVNMDPLKDISNIEIQNCYKEILSYRHDELIYLVNKLRYKLNSFHSGIVRKDFLYHYILNQYSLNTLNADIYEDNIQSDQFDNYQLYDLIIILGAIIFELEFGDTIIHLSYLLRKINMYINSIQGIKSLKFKDKKDCKKINYDFFKFCQKTNTSFGKGWMMVRNRNENFDIRECIDINTTTRFGLIGVVCCSKK